MSSRPSAAGAAAPPLSPLVRRLLRDAGLAPGDVTGTGPGGRIRPVDVRGSAGPPAAPGRADGPGASRLSPLVRRLLREVGFGPDAVAATGPGGRILPDDVRRAAGRGSAAAPSVAPAASSAGARSAAPTSAGLAGAVAGLAAGRLATAAWTTAALSGSAQLTTARDADVTALAATCRRVAPEFLARHGVALTPLALVARATCRALAHHPTLNASLDVVAGTVSLHGRVDLAFEVAGPDGPTFPVVEGADELNALGLARRIGTARAVGGPPPEAPQPDATFTLTDVGGEVLAFMTPLLRPGQVATLAVPRIERRPTVVVGVDGGERLAVREVVTLCLTYDHRLVDGADAARFLGDLADDLARDRWGDELAELG